MLRIESDTVELDPDEKKWIVEYLLKAFNLHLEKSGKKKITKVPRGSMSPFYKHLKEAIKEKTSRQGPLESSLQVIIIQKRLTFTDEKLLAIFDFIDYYFEGACDNLRDFFNEEDKEYIENTIKKLKSISNGSEFQEKFDALPCDILMNEQILLELGKYFENDLCDFEISDIIYKRIIEISSNELLHEYIARYFWYKTEKYGLAYSIYKDLLDSDNVDIWASIHIYNYHVDCERIMFNNPNYKFSFYKIIDDFNEISDNWLYLKYFFLLHFTAEVQNEYVILEIQNRSFSNYNQLLEYYLYIYCIKGIEDVENTIFN